MRPGIGFAELCRAEWRRTLDLRSSLKESLQCALSVCCCLPQELDRWEERLEELFEGRPYDEYDAALTETISRFPVDIQPFRDMARPPTNFPINYLQEREIAHSS